MKSEDLREAVIAYANQTSIKECALLFDGVVSYSTIYKWVYDSRTLSYEYTPEQCLKELNSLANSPASYNSLPLRNRIVHTFQPHFFDIERSLWQDKSARKKLIENRVKYLSKTKFSDREILRGFKVSGIHIGYSHFSPMWLKRYIQDENIKIVYDPCGGWGHRLIGAYISNAGYIYNDLWTKSYGGCKNIAEFIGYNCKLYNKDCTQFTPDEEYDCVFTCPPYYNVEIYNERAFKNIEEYNTFLSDMLRCSIKQTVKSVGIVINKSYEQNVLNAIGDEFMVKSRHVLGTTDAVSHLSKAKNSNKQEILLNFCRCE